MIQLGSKVKDRVTGFVGIAITECRYLNGCIQYCIKGPADKEGKIQDGHWFDEEQLVVVGKGVAVKPKLTGGGMREHP